MKMAIMLFRQCSLFIAVSLLSLPSTVVATKPSYKRRLSLCTQAFTHRHVASSTPHLAFANNVLSKPVRGLTTSMHLPISSIISSSKKRGVGRFHDKNILTSKYGAPIRIGTQCLLASPDGNDSSTKTDSSDITETKKKSVARNVQDIAVLVGAQGLLIPLSILLAKFLDLPNRGLGSSFLCSSNAFMVGVQWTIPLFALAGVMQLVEPYSPALQDVTRATQRSVLAVMGSKRRPIYAMIVSILLGAVAGWGEEWLFRGVFQTKMSLIFGNEIALAVSGLVFGLLHAVTPVYALLAGAASVFFGYLYNSSQNLAVPMICHAVYDVGALLWAHYTVTGLSNEEQQKILEGGPGAPILSTSRNDLV